MKKNPLVLLSSLVVVLLLVAYAAGVFDRQVTTIEVPSLDLTADDIASVSVEGPDFALKVGRGPAGLWRLEEPGPYPADTAQVGRFIRALAGFEPETVISTNPDRYPRYGLDSTARILTVTRTGGRSHELLLGKNGPDYQSTYVRLDDDPRVYLAQGRLTVPTDPMNWRDKTVLDIPTALVVSRVQAAGPDRDFAVENPGDGWQLVAGDERVEADSAAVARWLRLFTPMKAVGFLPALTPDSVTTGPHYDLTITLQDQTEFRLRMKEREADLAVIRDEDADVFKFNKYQKATLLPDPETLKKK